MRGSSTTVETGGGASGEVIVRLAEPETPSTVAFTGTTPIARPVTVPDDETLASSELPTDQVTVFPVRIAPLELRATAVACEMAPTRMLVADRLRVTDVTVFDGGAVEETDTAMLPVNPDAAA